MNRYDIWFCLVKLSHKIKSKLIKYFENTENIWYYSVSESTTFNLNEVNEKNLKKTLTAAWNLENINAIQKLMEKENIQGVTIQDLRYPKAMSVYEDAPYALFYKGDLECITTQYNIAIVGSRACTNYGIDITKILVEALCKNNITIVSGLAKGIDTIAHGSTIKNSGYTCAVLGCGIDIVYPRENKVLYNEILKKGCILSEFLPGTPPYSYNFPIRNRIISGISNIVIVVEAGYKSGSLITASSALEQGKDVIAIPGSIFSEQSKGSNKLIKDGAYMFTCMEDLFDLIGIKYAAEKKSECQGLSALERKIFNVILNAPIHIDDIMKITNIDIKQLYEVLFEMQLKNKLICLAGNYYARVMQKI